MALDTGIRYSTCRLAKRNQQWISNAIALYIAAELEPAIVRELKYLKVNEVFVYQL